MADTAAAGFYRQAKTTGHESMIKTRYAVAVTALALMGTLSACGDNPSSEDPESPPASPSAESTPAESQDQACSGLTAQEALDEWISEVPPNDEASTNGDEPTGWEWKTDLDDESGYGECADLSWIDIGITQATGSSPKHVMLFHQGEFVMTATVEPEGFIPSIEQIADDKIEITFGFLNPGESTAEASGEATSTYRWDEEQQTVVRTGDLPDGSESEAQTVESDQPEESTSSCAGGFELPDGVDESVCGEPADDAEELPPGEYGSAVIFTPSQNIVCSFTEDVLDCSMLDPVERINLDTSGEAYTPNRDDGPAAEQPMTVDYGHSVTFGPFACISEEIGLSCWNTETQHGLFLSREQSHMW